MSITFAVIDPVTQIKAAAVAYKCGNEHSLFIETPPTLAIRQFYSWSQKGIAEILGGRTARPIVIECWIHDSTFTDLSDIDAYLSALDNRAGEFGELSLTAGDDSVLLRKHVRFVGFNRTPFDGQRRPEPLPAIGVSDPASYGAWHASGELHFSQINVDPSA